MAQEATKATPAAARTIGTRTLDLATKKKLSKCILAQIIAKI